MRSKEAIPFIEVRGSHHQVGLEIGKSMKATLQRMYQRMCRNPPPGMTWHEVRQHAKVFLDHSREAYPQYVEELEGIAEGAEIAFMDLFPGMCEALWEPAFHHRGGKTIPRRGASPQRRGCTDFAARGAATTDGSTLLAHTNDLPPETEQDLVIMKVQAKEEPEFLAVSVGGLGISAGFNAAGISLTGNELASNDTRPGVPRLLIVRSILAASRLGEAMDACLHPQRASSYNNIIADSSGEIYCMEGSATDCEAIYIEDDVLAHANHYTAHSMRSFEANRTAISGSIIRHNRARRLLRENFGELSVEALQGFLADHFNYPASICNHSERVKTVFGMVIDLTNLVAYIGRGRPCQTKYLKYRLKPSDSIRAETVPESI